MSDNATPVPTTAPPSGRDHEWAAAGHFRIDGFVPAEVGEAMLADVVAVVRAAESPLADGGALVLPEANLRHRTGTAEELTSKVFKLHRRPAFTSFLGRPVVVDVLVERLGDDIDCFLSQFIFKNPGAWGQPWHQDAWYFPFEPAGPLIGLWLAVTAATPANGCLQVVAGSQAESVHDHVPDRRPGANYGYVEIVDHDMGAAVPVLMEPGDLLVFDSHLMHRSTDNRSDGIRAAMVFHFAPAGMVDRTEELTGRPSPVNDWAPVVRAGRAVTIGPTP